ncbi:hypothetical protein PSH85_06050 [Pseudomonas simiae]|uniref:hypothetical protein n=1 Tax=Pseudomonas simiae TaxID=321846 RepID=UPI002732DE7B|nr:hypothetical protein [Pseudomonas simiae]WLG35332.1 hypothetical protein PSH82_06045 [Pseudomonas simiae]WLI25284.1 hypothetical protein PSH85_06050 [Pseudomonas simiae]
MATNNNSKTKEKKMQLTDALSFIAGATDSLFSTEVFIALTAAYIGAKATSKATTKAHLYATQKSELDELEKTRNTLKLIKVELTSAWEIYYLEYGLELLQLPEGDPCIDIFPIGENIFPIYDSAPSCLANIEPSISTNIVRIYMRVKGLISMINLNNADCQSAFSAGRHATQELANKAIAQGKEISDELTKKLDEYHDYYAHQEARKLRMGQTANSMKLLTIELKELLSRAEKDIDNFVSTSNLN